MALLRYHARMIIDAHTHIFPPVVNEDRDAYLQRDTTFRELYTNPKARIATAEELIASMDEAGIDKSVACGFGWSDAELCREHNDYLLEAAERSGGRLIPFCTIQPSDKAARDDLKRWASRGARGLGELRPVSQGYSLIDSDEADLLSWACDAYDLVLLFHASEPVGHAYPGKKGLPVEQLGRFIMDFPGVSVIGAHWGGGLPFYALMPEMRDTMGRFYVDSAATGLLYRPDVISRVIDLLGARHVLFGTDFPLVSQKAALDALREAPIDEEARALIEGGNARELLRLADG
ncbi:MAG: amidohydrolase family protein [Chloroflexi bacterium]|nr:amidohydrolase family protein [Chloroflexota bacterium]MCI0855406.1 amidohydrolase family protein [Chloroflexota bacterium]